MMITINISFLLPIITIIILMIVSSSLGSSGGPLWWRGTWWCGDDEDQDDDDYHDSWSIIFSNSLSKPRWLMPRSLAFRSVAKDCMCLAHQDANQQLLWEAQLAKWSRLDPLSVNAGRSRCLATFLHFDIVIDVWVFIGHWLRCSWRNWTLKLQGTKMAKRNLRLGHKQLKKAGVNPASSECVIDIGAGKKFGCFSVGLCPTLTASRCQSRSYWLTKVFASDNVYWIMVEPMNQLWSATTAMSYFTLSIFSHWGTSADDCSWDGPLAGLWDGRYRLEGGCNAHNSQRSSGGQLDDSPCASRSHAGCFGCSWFDLNLEVLLFN